MLLGNPNSPPSETGGAGWRRLRRGQKAAEILKVEGVRRTRFFSVPEVTSS